MRRSVGAPLMENDRVRDRLIPAGQADTRPAGTAHDILTAADAPMAVIEVALT